MHKRPPHSHAYNDPLCRGAPLKHAHKPTEVQSAIAYTAHARVLAHNTSARIKVYDAGNRRQVFGKWAPVGCIPSESTIYV